MGMRQRSFITNCSGEFYNGSGPVHRNVADLWGEHCPYFGERLHVLPQLIEPQRRLRSLELLRRCSRADARERQLAAHPGHQTGRADVSKLPLLAGGKGGHDSALDRRLQRRAVTVALTMIRMRRVFTFLGLVVLISSSPAFAADSDSAPLLFPAASRAWHIDWTASEPAMAPLHRAMTTAFAANDQTAAPPRAVEYSHAYQVR